MRAALIRTKAQMESSWAGFVVGMGFTAFFAFGVPVIRAFAQGVHP